MKDRVKKEDGVARRLQIKRSAGLDGRPASRLTVAGGMGDNLLSWLGIMVE